MYIQYICKPIKIHLGKKISFTYLYSIFLDLIKIYKTCLPESIECKPAGCYKENFTKFCVKKENATADLRKPVDTEFVEFCYCDSDLCNGQVSSTTKGNKGSKCVVSWIIFSFVVFVDVLELFIR